MEEQNMSRRTETEMAETVAKAHHTGKMANTLAKALAKRYAYRWQFWDFRGPNGQESAGIVDIVAIRKSGKVPTIAGLKKLDLFDIILIQVKGGSARRPTADDLSRLRRVGMKYDAESIVLFEWNEDKKIAAFHTLANNNDWIPITAAKLFGKPAKAAKNRDAPLMP